jgi:glutamate/tyrosine decarboxylase-like PLP-dependent enzyme
VRELIDAGMDAAIGSAGGRFFHFVVGGTTPAALAAEWLTAALDQNTGMWAASPFGAGMEVVATDWLKQLFTLQASWGGVLVTGGTMANYVGLAAADWRGFSFMKDPIGKALDGIKSPRVATRHPSL